MEQPLTEALVNYLASLPNVTVYGPRIAEPGRRVPVVSFTAAEMKSADISARLQVRRRRAAHALFSFFWQQHVAVETCVRCGCCSWLSLSACLVKIAPGRKADSCKETLQQISASGDSRDCCSTPATRKA